MAKNRVQCSLVFVDDDVYGNLVLQLKETKEFSSFLINLCTRYYYDERVRNLVDGGDEPMATAEGTPAEANIYAQINESLAVMEYLADEGRNTLEDGADIIDSVLSGAESSGIMHRNEDDLGDGFVSLNQDLLNIPEKKKTSEESVEKPSESSNESTLREEVNQLKDMFVSMQSMMQQLLGGNFNMANLQGVAQSNSNVKSQNERVTDAFEDFGSSDDDDFTDDLLMADNAVIEEEPNPDEGDASADLASLIASL